MSGKGRLLAMLAMALRGAIETMLQIRADLKVILRCVIGNVSAIQYSKCYIMGWERADPITLNGQEQGAPVR
ncbi:hypothetical protein A0U92_11870 [Acetobacter aceti]|uniref:Uncharacterized protein n=1 Tax=Acetobacter aceti TaxID=435 RepID=A0A1U9KI17_ACEAC|nr:hypothetical protein A0U92_11870 [Acetobacter aceti]